MRPAWHRLRPVLLGSGLLVGVVCAALACGPGAKVAKGPTRPESAWSGEDADLFDDGIDIGAVSATGGTGGTTPDDSNDLKITSRVYAGDGVVLAKVIGVSSEPVGEKNRYRLEFLVEGEALAGAKTESPFNLKIEPTSPAFGSVRSQDAQLIGKKFVVFFKRYASEDGDEPVTHFHLSPGNEHILSQVKAVATKKNVEGD
ncbi:MAG: hypothetical protein ABI175_19325 [Polyangiales bacterium]